MAPSQGALVATGRGQSHGSEGTPSSLRLLDFQRGAPRWNDRRATGASASHSSAAVEPGHFGGRLRRDLPHPASFGRLVGGPRVQMPSGRRTDGHPGEVGKSSSASGRQLAPGIRASAGRDDGHRAILAASADRRARKSHPGSTVSRLPGPTSFRARGSRQAQRGGLRTDASAPKRSPDRVGTATPSEGGRESLHTHATRKGHWTWRFMLVPWD
jgi:hypothetical protein